MKRGALIATILAGLAVFLVVLVLYLPASWVASLLPPQVRCGQLGGSVWAGECLGLAVQGTPLGDATWNVAAGRALTGRLVGDAEINGAAVDGRAEFDAGFSGAGELTNVSADFLLDPALLPQVPRDQRGNVHASFTRLVLGERFALRAAEGSVELRDLRQVGIHPLDLGSYRVGFDGTTRPDGTVVGTVADLGGPFAVQGTLTLTPPNAYLVQGFITGRTADAERLVREITLGAQPDASGRAAFSFEGTY